ncbi:tail fiber domain-containing protein [Psychroserpens sp.]
MGTFKHNSKTSVFSENAVTNFIKELVIIILFVAGQFIFAQVGIGNTDPKATLDITIADSNNPLNTDGILVPRVNTLTFTDLNADQNGMLVYLTTDVTISSVLYTKGFYYWDNGITNWNLIGGTNTGNTLDEAYDQGGAGIGRIINATDGQVRVQGSHGLYVSNNSSVDNDDALRVRKIGTGRFQDALSIEFLGNVSSSTTSTLNSINNRIEIDATNSPITGLNNIFVLSNNTGHYKGVFNDYHSVSGAGSLSGTVNRFASDAGFHRGFHNAFISITANDAIGLLNTNYSGPGFTPGVANYMGVQNIFRNNTNGRFTYGIKNEITGSGDGDKYGSHTEILSSSGGIHYGTYNDVQKANGYAAYLIGRTSLGIGTTNRYLMPTVAGTNNQIMTIDATGQMNFVDASTVFTSTDDQNISGSGLSGTDLTIGIENGTSEVVDLSSLQDGTGTDNQTIDTFNFNTSNNELTLEIENDGIAAQTVDLTSLNQGNTLDEAYDQDGNGNGRIINATDGAVEIINGNPNGEGLRVVSNSGGGTTTTAGYFEANGLFQTVTPIAVDALATAQNDFAIGVNTKVNTAASQTPGGNLNNYGLKSEVAVSNIGSSLVTNYGINSVASGGEINYGIQSYALGGLINWAAYFGDPTATGASITGNVYVKDVLEINRGLIYRYAGAATNVGDILQYTDTNGLLAPVDPSTIFTDTDDQNISGSGFAGTDLTIGIQNGTSEIIDLSSLSNTLDQAYDQGSAGAGRTITADNGAVRINGEDGFLITGTVGNGNSMDSEITGAGTRMFFVPNRAAFRAGYVDGSNWDNANIGSYSNAMGYNNIASGSVSTAIGFNVQSPSYSETTFGVYSTTYTPASTTGFNSNDKLFSLGNGNSFALRSNALTIYKSGLMNINDEYDMPLTDGTAGQVMSTNGTGNVTFSSIIEENSTASNGLTEAGNDIRLGGTLIQDTSISYDNFDTRYNLNGTGDFIIQDNGSGIFQIDDAGVSTVGRNMIWKEGNIIGNTIADLTDDNDDGLFRIYENGTASILLDANGTSVFNEQGLDRDFRVESDGNQNMLIVDASTNRVGIGTGTPTSSLHVSANSGSATPQIRVTETNATDGGRISFNNTVQTTNYWTLYGRSRNIASDSRFNLFHSAAGNVLIATGSGDIGIGTTPTFRLDVRENVAANYVAQIRNTNTGNDGDGLRIQIDAATPGNANNFIGFLNSAGAFRGRIDGTATGVGYNTTSDRRLKTNIESINNALTLIDKIQPRLYEYKTNLGTQEYGFIAQELQAFYPQAVSGSPGSDVTINPMMVDYGRLTPLLTAGIKELKDEVDSLKVENAALKAKLNQLESLEARLTALENKTETTQANELVSKE